ncbi:MAG: hypothetical protein J6D53_00855 [Blautia sp.]|nr:hypothetical protein [Blautia sp.]
MRNFIDNLERRYGKYGIPNLTMYMIACYVVGYILYYLDTSMNMGVLSSLSLNVSLILRGQVWRLVTWIIYPPSTGNILLFVISIAFFYYPLGNHLERAIGTFRYNLYIFGGIILTIIGAFILHFIGGGAYDSLSGYIFTTYYIALSVFLAFAMLYPDMQILLWFVIPIKMKWMALVYLAIMLYTIMNYLRIGFWFMIIPIVASLINFGLFYLATKDLSRYRPKEVKRRREFYRAMEPQGRAQGNNGQISKHKCAICGRTELDSPDLEFRFCSKCNGNYEYCQDHLFTHTHVQ